MLAAGVSLASESYVLTPGDLISIAVYENPDLTRKLRIPADGVVSLPLIGNLKADGLTIDRLAEELTRKFSEYLVKPQVQVFVEEYHLKEVSVLGEVRSPGLYKIAGNATLLEVISQAGGLTTDSGDELVVLRESAAGDSGERPLRIDAKRLFTPEGAHLNVLIKDKDTIHVPRVEAAASVFYIMGEVKSPGSYKMEPGITTTVLQAISLAGGFTDRASKGRVKITRGVGTQTMTFKGEMEGEVRPQDMIVVPESFF